MQHKSQGVIICHMTDGASWVAQMIFFECRRKTDQRRRAEKSPGPQLSWTLYLCASCKRQTDCPRRLRSWWCEPRAGRTCCWVGPSTAGRAPGTRGDLDTKEAVKCLPWTCATWTEVKTVLFVQTWISEHPCGDVGPCAHDVLHIQTGLQTSFPSSLGANNSIHLRQMLEGSPKHGHELSQVGRVEVLLQELKGGKKKNWQL